MITLRGTLLLATCLATTAVSFPALAQSAGDAGKRIDSIQSEITQLQQELKRMRSELAARDGQVRAAQTEASRARARADQAATQAQAAQTQTTAVQAQTTALQAQAASLPSGYPGPQRASSAGGQAAGTTGLGGTFNVGGVRVTLGGFLAAEGVYRTRNLTSDIGSTYNGIPTANSANYHTGEFRGSARQTRISLLAEGDIASDQKVSGYYESDFLGVGTTSNSNESNSYVPRLRQAYMTYDNTTLGVHFLAGQAWSLLTLNRVGITPRQENIPLTIDAQYVPGFNWKRQWQVRADADFFNHALWLGASVEEPQSTFYTGPNGLGVASGTALINNAGSSLLNSTTTYSNDVAPDVIVKAAFDPGWGHYEVFGLAKFIHDRVSVVGSGQNNTTLGGGVGGGLILPLIPKVLDFQFSGMTGYGIGTYGSGQLPDAILSSTGAPKPLPSYSLLGGLTAHPTPAVDIYGYVGTEQVQRTSFDAAGKAYGYGNPLYSNAGCNIELSTATCIANTSGITQGTIGGWWRFMKGNYGTLQAGAQYSYTRRTTFSGGGATANASSAPTTDDNMVLFSFRYLPFQ
jgi:outer membrane murein-binding lipoprotein Lpp